MSGRGIIFSGPMVRALLVGRKTQTRRVLKLPTKGIYEHPQLGGWEPTTHGGPGTFTIARDGTRRPAPEVVAIWHRTKAVCIEIPWQPGHRLWVRETWKPHSTFADVLPREIPPSKVFYAADDGYAPSGTPWRSPIHMPRWASRLTLAVTDVRVQRLQEISEEDARAEGIHPIPHSDGPNHYTVDVEGGSFSAPTATSVYPMLWSFIHGPAAWDANPWVAAITFSVEPRNIDTPAPVQMEDAA